jgi:hypothetical protein
LPNGDFLPLGDPDWFCCSGRAVNSVCIGIPQDPCVSGCANLKIVAEIMES